MGFFVSLGDALCAVGDGLGTVGKGLWDIGGSVVSTTGKVIVTTAETVGNVAGHTLDAAGSIVSNTLEGNPGKGLEEGIGSLTNGVSSIVDGVGGVGKHLVHGTGEVLSTTARAGTETLGHTLKAVGHAGQAAIDGMKETGELLSGTNRQGKSSTKS